MGSRCNNIRHFFSRLCVGKQQNRRIIMDAAVTFYIGCLFAHHQLTVLILSVTARCRTILGGVKL